MDRVDNASRISGLTTNRIVTAASATTLSTPASITADQTLSIGATTIRGASGTLCEVQNTSDSDRGLRIACITGTGVRVSTQSSIYPLILGQDGGNHLTISVGGTVFVGTDPGGSELLRVGGGAKATSFLASAGTLGTIGAFSSAASLDQKLWNWQFGSAVGDGTYRLRALNDAETNGINALTFTRTGIASVTATFGGATIIGTDPTGGELLRVGGTSHLGGSVTLADAANIIVSATTGTKIGTATTQKLSLWNATPVVQPASANQAAVATTAATNVAPYGFTTAGQADGIITLLNEIRAALVTIGAIKGAA